MLPGTRARLFLPASVAVVALAALSASSAAEPTSRATTEPSTATRPVATQPAATQPRDTQPTTRGLDKADADPAGKTPPRNSGGRKLYDSDDLRDSGTGFADTREMLWKMMASLLVLGVLGVAAWIVFRKLLPRIGRPTGRSVRLLETTYVGPRKAVHLLQVGRRRLLVSSSRDEVSLLADVTDAVGEESLPSDREHTGNAS